MNNKSFEIKIENSDSYQSQAAPSQQQSQANIKKEVRDVDSGDDETIMDTVEQEDEDEDEDEDNNSENEDDDPVVKELDVYLSKSLANKIFILQYPIRPGDRTFDDAKVLKARVKPKCSKIELEIDRNTTDENYSRVKGEQFAINVDGVASSSRGKHDPKQANSTKYFHSNVMDKVVLQSTNACLGQMNRLYHLALVRADSVHLTPIQGMAQMKPSFDYFDLAEKRMKDAAVSSSSSSSSHGGGGGGAGGGGDDYSTTTEEEGGDSEVEVKPELVTLKYGVVSAGSHAHQHQGAAHAHSEQEQTWVNVDYVKKDEADSTRVREALLCRKPNCTLKLDLSNEELIKKSIDFSYLNVNTATDSNKSEKN